MDVHAETLENLLASASASASAPVSLAPVSVSRGEVIEIQGPASSGKTHLVYDVLLSVLLPVSQVAAVVYDTDAAFDIRRFRHLLLSRIPSADPDPVETVRRALAHVHVFRPTSLLQLAASIANLPAYHASHMPNQEIAVLVIDSVSTFHWPDRLSAEQLRNIPSISVPVLHHVLHALQQVRCSHRPLVVLTNWALNPAPPPSQSLYRQHLIPFPVFDAEDAAAPTTTINFPFRLAHHIALSSPSSFPSPTVPLDDAPRHHVTRDNQASCFTRSHSGPVRFTLQVTDDGILFAP